VGFYRQFVGPSGLFFDIGANVGARTKLFTRLNLKVVSVEPQSQCVAVLRQKFSGNPNVIIEHCGVGSEAGSLELNICSKSTVLSSFSTKWQSGRFKDFVFDQKETVKIIKFDTLIEKYGLPDFCKIDVEGYELEVLSGLSHKVPCLNFEFVSEFIADTEKIMTRLCDLGFTQFNFTEGEKLNFASKEWLSATELLRQIKSKITKNSDLWGDVYAR
jgi:FkbM family methyltransferase